LSLFCYPLAFRGMFGVQQSNSWKCTDFSIHGLLLTSDVGNSTHNLHSCTRNVDLGYGSVHPWNIWNLVLTHSHVCWFSPFLSHYIFTKWLSGWWFGTFFMFPYIGNNNPSWHSYFQRGRYTTNQLSHHFFVSEVVIPFSHHVYAMFYRQSGLGARKSLPGHLCDDFCQSGQLCFNMFQHLAISKFVMFQHMKYYNMINSAIHITFDDIWCI